jgi:hypothetical protein
MDDAARKLRAGVSAREKLKTLKEIYDDPVTTISSSQTALY